VLNESPAAAIDRGGPATAGATRTAEPACAGVADALTNAVSTATAMTPLNTSAALRTGER
jgi:hypothetical protein